VSLAKTEQLVFPTQRDSTTWVLFKALQVPEWKLAQLPCAQAKVRRCAPMLQ
jgi:hypothetical protein